MRRFCHTDTGGVIIGALIQAGPWIIAGNQNQQGLMANCSALGTSLDLSMSPSPARRCMYLLYTHYHLRKKQSTFDHVYQSVQLEKSLEESCKDEIRFLNSLFRKVKEFDWFNLKKRDLITIFEYMQGFSPRADESVGTTCSVCTEQRR